MRDLGRRPPQGRVWEWHDGRRDEDRASLDAGPKQASPSFPRATSRSLIETADGPVARALTTSISTIQPGEFVSLIGPSGCGKTTLAAGHRRSRDGDAAARSRVNGMTPAGGAAEARLWLCVPGAGALSVAHHRAQRRAAAGDHGAFRRAERDERDRAQPRPRQPHRLRATNFPGSSRAACSSAPRSPARWPSIPICC